MNKKILEFGSQMQISAELKKRMNEDAVEQMLKENLRKDALGKGYTEVSEPKVSLGEQAFRIIGNDDEGYEYVPCSPTDKGAFFYVGAKMMVIEKELA